MQPSHDTSTLLANAMSLVRQARRLLPVSRIGLSMIESVSFVLPATEVTTGPTGPPPVSQFPTPLPVAVPSKAPVSRPTPSPETVPSKLPASMPTLSPVADPSPRPQAPPSPSPSTASKPSSPTTNSDAIQQFLTETLTDKGSLTKPKTPQNLAFKQLLLTNPDLDPAVPADQVEITQRYVLNTIYYSSTGDEWTAKNGWTTASDICDDKASKSWFGITCKNQQVTFIELGDNNLVGTIPSEIRGLSTLKKYDVNKNTLYGAIPTTIGQLTSLGTFFAVCRLTCSMSPPRVLMILH